MPMSPRLMRPLARRQAPAPAFLPNSLTGLVGWYDASDNATLKQNSNGTTAVAEGDPIGYWGDKSGQGNNLIQSVNNNRPVMVANATNGLPSVSFDGLNDTLISGFDVNFAGTQQIVVCMAMKRKAASAAVFSVRRESDADYLTGMLINSGDYGADNYALTWGRGSGSSTNDIGDLRSLDADTQEWGIISAYIDGVGNSAVLRQRGVGPSSSSGYPLTPSGWLSTGEGNHALYVGSRAYNTGTDPVAWAECEIAELVVYKTFTSSASVLAVEQYLTTKWIGA